MILFIYFLERGEGKEKERERNINVWLLLCPLLGTWPTTQACALTGNPTGDPLVQRPAFNPLSHTRQDIENFCTLIWTLIFQGVAGFLCFPGEVGSEQDCSQLPQNGKPFNKRKPISFPTNLRVMHIERDKQPDPRLPDYSATFIF